MLSRISKVVVDSVLGRGISENFEIVDKDWLKILKQASNNRVLYKFTSNLLEKEEILSSKQIEDLEKIVNFGERELIKFRDTIEFLNNTLGAEGMPFLVVKTFKFLDYVTYDVDVLVPYEIFIDSQKVLEESGCKILPHPRKQGLHQRNCQKNGLLNIDLHRKFYWQGLDHIDLDFVWAKVEKRRINGIECPCPSLEADFLLHNKQLVYERYYVTLLDFWAVKCAYESGLNMDIIEEQVKKYKWCDSYKNLLKHLNTVNFSLFEAPLFESEPYENRDLSLPYIYPYLEVLSQCVEIFQNQREIPAFDFAYYHYVYLKYYLTGKQSLPYYQHWFKFNTLN